MKLRSEDCVSTLPEAGGFCIALNKLFLLRQTKSGSDPNKLFQQNGQDALSRTEAQDVGLVYACLP
ncbi:hypothetical protein M513_01465 [Trichuris suis]|uniref:Uncharacterized protein n=1 Tax=Trichuris suis TaxID=68888 RepID=A0A085MKP9_9BILA|nr:hypothetical protein M513_01465 [Trichuris suis]